MMAEEIEEGPSFKDLSACIDGLQDSVSEMLNLLKDEASDAQKIGQWEKEMKDLEDSEKKLIEEFNKVMANHYLLPGYILAASTGISGFLSSDPRLCWLVGCVKALIVIFVAAMGLAICSAYRQLTGLQARTEELVIERDDLRKCFNANKSSFNGILQASNPALMRKMENYEPRNQELDIQAQHFRKFLLFIIMGGLLFASMFVVAAYYVLCYSKSVPCTPCTPHTPRLHSEIMPLHLTDDM